MMNCFPKNRSQTPRRQTPRKNRRGTSDSADMMILAGQGKFDEIMSRLQPLDTTNRLGSMYITNPHEAAYPLHALLRHRPPVALVDALIHKLQADVSTLAPGALIPEEVRENVLHQTPLHIAVAYSCSLDVIERLLQGESLCMPAMAKDGLHRFPLHWACAIKHKTNWRQRSQQVDYRWDLIHYLLEQYPVAAVIGDMYDQTPLDYAIHNKMHASIIELLQEAASEYERYAPPRKDGSSPLRDHTEVTSEASEDLIPDSLPSLIFDTETKKSKWWYGGDDVSSLGGDFPTLLDDNPISHVKSLFSSALSFSSPVDEYKTSTTSLEDEVNASPLSKSAPAANTPAPAANTLSTKRHAQPRPTPTSLLGKSEGDSSGNFEEDIRTSTSTAVRAKTLLKGNIQIKSPRKPRTPEPEAIEGFRVSVVV